MKINRLAAAAAIWLCVGSVQSAPIARLILNSDPGEWVGDGQFNDITIESDTYDQYHLNVLPLDFVPPVVGFEFNFVKFDQGMSGKFGYIQLFGMNPGATADYGSLSFFGAGCNHSDFSSQTYESVVSGFEMTRFVATFSQTCFDTPDDMKTRARGIFIYDKGGNVSTPGYFANSPVFTQPPAAVPEPSAVLFLAVGSAMASVVMLRRKKSAQTC